MTYCDEIFPVVPNTKLVNVDSNYASHEDYNKPNLMIQNSKITFKCLKNFKINSLNDETDIIFKCNQDGKWILESQFLTCIPK